MKSQELLNRAGKALSLGAVFLKNSDIAFNDLSAINGDLAENIKQQSFNAVINFSISVNEDTPEQFLYQFEYSVGIRVVDISLEEEDEYFLKAKVEATFIANYVSSEELDKECLDEFARVNVGYHVWPYWREFVQSACNRAGTDPIIVPLYRAYQKAVSEESE